MRIKHVMGAVLALAAGMSQAAGFVNGDFEAGDLSGWTSGGGCRAPVFNNNLNPNDYLPGGSRYGSSSGCAGTGIGGVTGHSQVVGTSYVDPNVGSVIGSTVYSGQYSARIEDTTFGGYASVLSQTVTNYTDNDIFFAWKAVLLGAHGINDAATFIITLTDLTDNVELVRREYNAAAFPGAPFSQFNGNYYTRDWQIEQLTVGATGHDYRLTVLAADCEPTGHWGYVYLDGFGAVTPPPGVPEPGSLALAGLALAGVAASRRRKA